MFRFIFLMMIWLPASAGADVLTAARTLPAGTIISAEDLRVSQSNHRGLTDPEEVIGKQARITIYEGRPLQATLLQAPQLISRNQIVRLVFERGGLRIEVAGRALAAGAAGDVISVMNLDSRVTVYARVNQDGTLSAL